MDVLHTLKQWWTWLGMLHHLVPYWIMDQLNRVLDRHRNEQNQQYQQAARDAQHAEDGHEKVQWARPEDKACNDTGDLSSLQRAYGVVPSLCPAEHCPHPILRALDSAIRENHRQILAEVDALMSRGYYGLAMVEMDPVQLQNLPEAVGWTPLWIKFLGQRSGVAKHMPTLSSIVSRYDNHVSLLHVSIMKPGTMLRSHVGITKGVLRYHYGLRVPEGYTGMLLEGTYVKWCVGRGVVWDDTIQHSSFNYTDSARLIIFADVYRELPWWLDVLNRSAYWLIQQTRHVKGIQQMLKAQGRHLD